MDSNIFWAGKKVFITGATGFKGSWLTLYLLRKGAEVWGYSLKNEDQYSLFNELKLDSRNKENSLSKFKNYYADICDMNTLRTKIEEVKPEFIFHLAAQSLVIKGYKNPLETWETNLMGSVKLLEVSRNIRHKCVIIIVTTDKVYENKEWDFPYRENDRLGGNDPYSASKAALEIAVDSWRKSFIKREKEKTYISLATVRAGNVIGGGDWSDYRIVPDCIKALEEGKKILIRNPSSTRPWQHVLEPLNGYLKLAEKIFNTYEISNNAIKNINEEAYNFGPDIDSNKSVIELVNEIFKIWPGKYYVQSDKTVPYEAKLLSLSSEKAKRNLNWENKWSFQETIHQTINWYRKFHSGTDALQCCIDDIESFEAK